MQFSEVETVASEYAICTHTGRWERIDSNMGWVRTSRSMLVRLLSCTKNEITNSYFCVFCVDTYHELFPVFTDYIVLDVDEHLSLQIEDPFERPENAARTVGPSELRVISNAFTDAYNKLSSSSVLANRNSLISSLTRPLVSSQLGVRSRVHYNTTGTAAIDSVVLDRFENVMRLDRQSHASTSAATVSRRANENTLRW